MKILDATKRRDPISDIEAEQIAQQRNLLQRAQMLLDEQEDAVKHLNQLVLYSQCATIREAQLEEKASIEAEKKEQERRADMVMEMERLKALRLYEEREKRRLEDRKKGASVIVAQIQDREKQRLLEAERKRREQETMLSHISKMRDEDDAMANAKKDASKRLMEEVSVANAEQMRLKQRAAEVEAAEEARIAAYLADKAAREAERQAELDRIRQEKERETARLRAMQEKAQDKAAVLDALRAKRAQEQLERDYRQKEAQQAERQQRIQEELAHAREMQMLEKERRLAAQAAADRAEHESIVHVQREMQSEQHLKQSLDKERNSRYNQELQAQISETREMRRKTRKEFMEEGLQLRRQEEEHKAKLEEIRRRKVEQLETMGVPKKYTVELATKKLEKTKFA